MGQQERPYVTPIEGRGQAGNTDAMSSRGNTGMAEDGARGKIKVLNRASGF